MLPVAAMGLGAGAFLLFAPTTPDPEFPTVVGNDTLRDLNVPIQAVGRRQWLDFVKVFTTVNPKGISANYRLGVFEMTVRRLCDLGVMENPRRFPFKNTLVWDADWIEPASLKTFLHDVMGQYGLFAQSVGFYSGDPAVLERVGTQVDGNVASLSGVLGVAHRAGLPGLASWFDSAKERQRFSRNTTAYFERCNGIF